MGLRSQNARVYYHSYDNRVLEWNELNIDDKTKEINQYCIENNIRDEVKDHILNDICGDGSIFIDLDYYDEKYLDEFELFLEFIYDMNF